MPGFRKSPLSSEVIERTNTQGRKRNVVNISILQRTVEAKQGQFRTIDFSAFYPLLQSDIQRPFVINIAQATHDAILDGKSQGSEYGHYNNFLGYLKFCHEKQLNAFSRSGYIAYCGHHGELLRLIQRANKPKPFLHLYEHMEPLGMTDGTANNRRSSINTYLMRSKQFDDRWLRHTPKFSIKMTPTKPYSSNEKAQVFADGLVSIFSQRDTVNELVKPEVRPLPKLI